MSNNRSGECKFFLTVVILCGWILSYSQVSHEDSLQYLDHLKMSEIWAKELKGKTVRDFVVRDKNGISVTRDRLRSKITFINFWFLSCAPCVAEFQAVEKFYNNNKSRENFQFISITFEADSVIDQVRKKNNLTYPIYQLSSDSCRKIIGLLGYPATLIVNKDLEVIYAVGGGPTDRETADKYLNYFLQAELEKQFINKN